MTLVIFDTAAELQQYVVDQPVLQAAINTILTKDGKWYLFHF